MKKWRLALGVALGLGGCASPGIDTAYKGADGGVLVASIGYIAPAAQFYYIYYRRTDGGPPLETSISIHTETDISRTIDYRGHAEGSVVIQHLQPGHYEIFSTSAVETDYYSSSASYKPQRNFSLSFVIKPGETTYIGRYDGVMVKANKHGWLVGDYVGLGGVSFVVSDQHERDIAVAKTREPNLPPVTAALPDPAKLPEPYFLEKEPGLTPL